MVLTLTEEGELVEFISSVPLLSGSNSTSWKEWFDADLLDGLGDQSSPESFTQSIRIL
jgi:hypothetical protein